jgi:alpha-2-macroglobulin
MIKGRYHSVILSSLFLTMSFGFAASTGQSAKEPVKPEEINWNGDFAQGWRQFNQLANKQKYEVAMSLADKMLAEARAQKNNIEWTSCLIHYSQLRMSRGGYETTIRFLKDQPWPDDWMGSSVLNLYYAKALTEYVQRYSYEINRREKKDSKGTVDLKSWTREQIHEEALKAFTNVWKLRSQLGGIPKDQWKEYIDPNNYPPGIRSTMRDVVSYLGIEILGNTGGWRPDQLNEIYQLNLKYLIGGNISEISFVDPAQHPLAKICFILADLENWHAQRKEREAALEARLERYRYLHANFTNPEDRKYIQNHLEKYLTPLANVPWWSEGMAQLAEFVQARNEELFFQQNQSSEPDALMRARQIANRGKAAYPESYGGKHCLDIKNDIEVPDYSLSGMQNDNPQKKSILVKHKNLDKLYFRAYPIDLFKTIETSDGNNLLLSYGDLEELTAGKSQSHQWEIALPATPDYRMHKTFVVPPMTKPGVYLIVASGRSGFSEEDNNLKALYLTLGNLDIDFQTAAGNVEATVLASSNGRPVAGAEVTLYQFDRNNHHHQKESKLSDGQGKAQFTCKQQKADCLLVARLGDQISYNPQMFNFYNQEQNSPSLRTLIFTDRSIYRPLQKIYWKAVLYKSKQNEIRFETSPAETFTVSLMDLNNQVVESRTVTTNSFGTASGEFIIPSGRALGGWHLESSLSGKAGFQVAEYKRPAFEVKMLDPKESLRLNWPAHLKGEAKYYFGLPVSKGKVKWVVTRQPELPWRWEYCRWIESYYHGSEPQMIASGIESLKEDGTFSFTYLPHIDKRLGNNKEVSYRYSISVDVTDEGGETYSAQRSFHLGFVSVKASANVETESYPENMPKVFLENAPIEISVSRTSLDDIPKAGKGTWKIAALKAPSKTLLPAEQPLFIPKEFKGKIGYLTPGDLERERWESDYNPAAVLLQWEEGSIRASGRISHDEKGHGEISVRHLSPGAYRLIYETMDDYGAKYELRKSFIVGGSSMQLPLPAILSIENTTIPVGGKARILAYSGFKDQLMVLEIFRNGACIQRKEMISGKDPSLIEIPITEKDRGRLGVSMSLLRDNQFIQFEDSLIVPWDNKELKLAFSTFRDRLHPGSNESWTVKATGPAGKEVAVPAVELLAYMCDRSLDAFGHHLPADPANLYYQGYWPTSVQSNMAESDSFELTGNGFNSESLNPFLTKDKVIIYAPDVAIIHSDSVRDIEYEGRGGPQIIIKHGSFAPNLLASPMMRPSIKPIELRSDFSETAFWQPHLLTGPDGSATIEFKVPDSVTSWSVWVHAITQDFKSGFVHREAQSVKNLMVRPYLPRFLREGDQAEIKVVVNNASDHELKGVLNFDIIDVATDQSVLSQFGLSKSDASDKPFTVDKGSATNLTFPIKTPAGVGQIAFKVTATSGDFSDGELRPVPILPGRMRLMQSRFVTLKDQAQRVMRFDDLARNDDPTRINEQMVVTLDAQLFYSVLSALPYLVNYPYECTEQTLNRFLSTGILSSLYKQYPAIDRMAKEFSSRETRFEKWDAADPNRKMALEETPWLQMAKGGDDKTSDLFNMLDSRIAKAERESALAKLRQMQTSSGGFPWFPGGPPSPYMTLYLLHGFSKALEFGVDVPREIVKPAWDYMHRHYMDEIVKNMMSCDCGWETVTFLNYILSNYPDSSWYEGSFTAEDRQKMLDFSFKHWRLHSNYLKEYLALTLKRMDRPKDALLVWESVMDSAKTAEDQGTFWAPEDRAWLWYNDTIETHAFAIRTDMELLPQDPKLDGMVLWLFLNKKMDHWKSTRATAEVIYSLAHYLKKTGQLGIREDATVTVGNQKTSFIFEPDRYTGKKNQIVIPGEKIDPKSTSAITVEKTSKAPLFASATWHFSTEKLPEEERGDYLKLSRSYFKRVSAGKEFILQPLREGATLAPGDEVEVQLSLTSKHPMEYVHLRDPRAAGFEPASNLSQHKWDLGISWYEEIRDSGTNFFFEHLPQGEYTFKYSIRATTAGAFKVAPATVQPMYAPEFAAYSSGATITISVQ